MGTTLIIIHDEDNTHSKLVDVLGLKSKTYLSKDMKGIPDELNPLAPVNNVHDKLKKFLNVSIPRPEHQRSAR